MIRPLTVFLTDSCNLDCVYCKRGSSGRTTHLEPDLVRKIVAQAHDSYFDGIVLTGGEPSRHPGFREVAETILEAGLGLGLVTNGWDHEPYESLVDDLDFICVSLDGVDEAHDVGRGKGSFRRAVEAIRSFAGRTDVRTMTVVTPSNMNKVVEIVGFAKEIGVTSPNFCGMVPTVQQSGVLSDKQRQDCISLLKYAEWLHDTKCIVNESLWTGGGLLFCPGLTAMRDVSVRPDGKFRLCCDIDHGGGVVGDVANESLADLLMKAKGLADEVIEIRESCLKRQGLHDGFRLYDGFDTCLFCDRILKELDCGKAD
jgi:MoaA/NifB/PqqE/SkfB family radical SAM enzyme